jgi:Spy/CpxP family protein refolding chaperone
MQALNLSDEQKAKVAPILEKTKSDVQAIRANNSLSKQQKHEQIGTLRQSTAQQLQSILTPEQFQKFQQMKAEHKAGHEKGENASGPVT